MALFIQLTIGALILAGVYALVAFGIQLVYGLTNLVNFAHGALMTLGAYTFVSLFGKTKRFSVHLNIWLAGVLAVVGMAAVGYLLERFLFRRTLHVPISGFIVSLGLILVLVDLYSSIWSPYAITFQSPLPHVYHLGGATVTASQLFSLAVSVVALIALLWWVVYTKYGRALRACAEDPEMARLLGVPTQRIISAAFTIGTASAGLAGVLLAFELPVSPQLGTDFVITGFTVALVGGLGSIPGAVIGALLVGAMNSYAAGYLPSQWTPTYVFALMLLVLLIRPTGILGGRQGAHL